MSDDRRRILEGVRRAVGPASAARNLDATHAEEVAGHDAPRPRWAGTTAERFQARVEAAAASLATMPDFDAVPEAVAAFVREHALEAPHRLDVAPHPDLAALEWPAGWDVHRGTPRPDAVIGLARGFAGVAETGSVALPSGPHSPAMLNSLPEYYCAVLRRDELVDYLEDLWARMREREDFPPRVVNLVTGPSRTADVEQTLQLGAHGPREVRVILVG